MTLRLKSFLLGGCEKTLKNDSIIFNQEIKSFDFLK